MFLEIEYYMPRLASTCYVAKADLDSLPASGVLEYHSDPPSVVYSVVGIKHRAFCKLDKHPIIRLTGPAREVISLSEYNVTS